MKKHCAKFISMFLCFVMTIIFVPSGVFAQTQSETGSGYLEQEIQAGNIEVIPVSREEFIQLNAENGGISYSNAEETIDAYESRMLYREENSTERNGLC